MKPPNNQQGIAHLPMLILLALVIAIIGYVGIRVMKASNSPTSGTTSSQESKKLGDYEIKSKKDLAGFSDPLKELRSSADNKNDLQELNNLAQ